MNDETRCDACGQPTPRLDPPTDVELCDACWRAEQHAAEIMMTNDAIVTQQTAEWLFGHDPRRI